MNPKDQKIRDLRQRVKRLRAEARRHKRRAEEAEFLLGLADAQLVWAEKFLPAQVNHSMGWH